MLAMATQEQDRWDTYLPFISKAYWATPQESTDITANFLMFG